MQHRICTYCVMDSSNPAIVFDDGGVCNCCRDAIERRPFEWFPGDEGRRRLDALVRHLKASRRGSKYDAMIGLSGGIDSAYLAHLLRTEYDLRLLAVHVDGGWNTEAAVRNIEILVRRLDIDLHTEVIEWAEMRDLQLAFLQAAVLNQDMPQDHAFFSTLYRTARRFGVRNFLSGVNFSSECVMPAGWGYPAMDGRHVRAVHRRFGHSRLQTFPIMGILEYFWSTRVRRQLTIHRPLNFTDYNKIRAMAVLIAEYGYRDYGGKHCESRFTKFYQEIYLPERFGFDKRRLHLSSQIVSGQISRHDALEEVAAPICSPDKARHEVKFVAKKLRVSVEELRSLLSKPQVDHTEYPNSVGLYRSVAGIKRFLRLKKLAT